MAGFDLNLEPMDEDEEVLQEARFKPKEGKVDVDNCIYLPAKKRILKVWNETTEKRGDQVKETIVCSKTLLLTKGNNSLINLPHKKRLFGDRNQDDRCNDAAQKRQKAEKGVSLHPKTPPIEETCRKSSESSDSSSFCPGKMQHIVKRSRSFEYSLYKTSSVRESFGMRQRRVHGGLSSKPKTLLLGDSTGEKQQRVQEMRSFEPKTLLVGQSSGKKQQRVQGNEPKKLLAGESSGMKQQIVKGGQSFESRKLVVGESPEKKQQIVKRKKLLVGESSGKKRQIIVKGSRSFEPRTMFAGESPGTANKALPIAQYQDASQLLPDYIKNYPEFTDITDVKLIIKKTLQVSDNEQQQGRLSIPCRSILTKFLCESEDNWLDRENPNGKGGRSVLMVKAIGPCSVHDLPLSKWNYKGNGFRYAIKGSWLTFKNENNLDVNDSIHVVSFRCNKRLCLAIFKPPPSSSSPSSFSEDPKECKKS